MFVKGEILVIQYRKCSNIRDSIVVFEKYIGIKGQTILLAGNRFCLVESISGDEKILEYEKSFQSLQETSYKSKVRKCDPKIVTLNNNSCICFEQLIIDDDLIANHLLVGDEKKWISTSD